MNLAKNEEFIWSQEYRPRTIDDCILPVELKNTFKSYIASGQLQNMLLAGSAGTGKTSAALALCDEIDADVLFINASLETGVDVVRTKLAQFTSTVSLQSKLKVIILDEVDRSSAQFQDSLKSFMETFSKNTRFILITNHKEKIIDPIQSRCALVEFKIPAKEKPKLAKQLLVRLKQILDEKNIEYDEKVIRELILKFFPDNRKIINELQRYSISGKIDVGILVNFSDDTFRELVVLLKENNFPVLRKWVNDNSDIEPSMLFNKLYSTSKNYVEDTSIPELVLILSKYSYQSTLVVDHELNNIACFVEIMGGCSFK